MSKNNKVWIWTAILSLFSPVFSDARPSSSDKLKEAAKKEKTNEESKKPESSSNNTEKAKPSNEVGSERWGKHGKHRH